MHSDFPMSTLLPLPLQGSSIRDAKKLAMLALYHLPKHCQFNIIGFGSGIALYGKPLDASNVLIG